MSSGATCASTRHLRPGNALSPAQVAQLTSDVVWLAQSSENQVGANSFSQQGIDRVAGLYVSGPTGVLLASAGKDFTLAAAQVQNTGTGPTELKAGANVNLNTVQTASSADINWNANNYVRQSSSQEVGSSVSGTGAVNIQAGQDVNLRAAQVDAQGALGVQASAGGVNIEVGHSSESLAEGRQVTTRGNLSKTTTTTRSSTQSTTAQSSELGGQTVNIQSGADTRVKGSNVLADQRLDINAGGKLSIEAAQNIQSGSSFNETKKSGLVGSGGIGFTIGKQQQSTDAQNTQTTAAASTVGTIDGNVNLSAGQTYTQRGSDVVAPGGDVNISAQRVSIEEAREAANSQTEQKAKQSGLTVAVNVPIVQSAQALANTVEATGNTGSSRMQALGAAAAALQAKELADQAAKLGEALAKGTDIKQAAGISLSVGLGSSKSQSNSSQRSDNARGSSVTASGDVNISARGAGKESDITIQGSTVKAGDTTRLSVEDEVKLLAAKNTQTESNNQSSKSGSVGLTFATTGISATASASRGQGQGAGNGTTFTNAQVSGQSVQITSGSDTTVKGAVVQGEQVAANVGGNLNIESLQNSSRYNESSKNAGFSVSVPITGVNGGGASASVSAGKTNIKSNFSSVGEQSAIRAGDGGFQVRVQGDTDLKGGQITSTQAAIDNNQNSYEAQGGTTTRDLQNTASYQAKSVGVGVGTSGGKVSPSGVGVGSDKGSDSSTTTAGISGVAGNTAARTGDQETGIGQIFNKDEVKAEVAAQVTITQEAGKHIPKAIADQMGQKRDELKAQAKTETDPDKKAALLAEAAKYDEGGVYRIAAHTTLGALAGGADGALGAAASSAAAPTLDTIQGQLQNALQSAGMSAEASQQVASLSTGAMAATIGGATGGTAGAGTAFNADMNNRQLHPTEKQRIKDLAKGDAQKEARLTAAACALVKCYAEYPEGSVAYNTLKAMADAGGSDAMAAERQQLQAQQGLFNYSRANEALDSAKQINNTYQVTTRVVGAGQALLGGAGVVTSVLTAPASCPTGIGCVANAAVATISADAAVTGVKQAISGQPENTYLNQALQGLGLSPEAASYAEFALGVGAAAKVGSVVNAATATQAANNAAARISYEDIAKFGAKGLNATPEVMQTPQARALMAEYQAAGLTADDAIRYSTGVLQTGNALPVVRTVAGNEELIKVVPKNVAGSDGVGAFSPYFMTRSEYDALSKLSPAEIGQRLGLPAEQSVRGAQLGFEAFAITPKPGTAPKVFTSTVAPVEQGSYKAVGGAQQTIVPNRSLWTEPKPIGTIGGNK